MELFYSSTIFLIGLAVLAYSSDNLIKSSVKLAYLFKLSTLFIGLILVAFGTSLPEGSVSLTAVIKDYKNIALGNVVGSNIANIALVLGVSGLVRPLKINPRIFRWEVPLMIFSTGLLFLFCWDGVISRFEGFIFLLLFVIFCIFSFKVYRLDKDTEKFNLTGFIGSLKKKSAVLVLFAVFLFFLVFGANMMVNSGVKIAQAFGVNTWIIGLTVFAVGTSLPELAASVQASFKNVSSIGLGNVIGSNIFNILFILGLASSIRPIYLQRDILRYELPLLFMISVLVALLMRNKNRISRLESGLLLFIYVIFIVSLFIR